MRVMPRVRMLLARRPWIHWTIVAILASSVGVVVSRDIAAIQRQRDRWGATTAVVVATRNIAPGDAIAASTAHVVRLPLAMVPMSALHAVPARLTATQHIAAGEVIVALDTSPAAGPAALLPIGWLAIGVESLDSARFRLGDRATVLADGQTVAADAVVVAVGDARVVVGVPAGSAADVARAAAQHLAVVALAGVEPPSESR